MNGKRAILLAALVSGAALSPCTFAAAPAIPPVQGPANDLQPLAEFSMASQALYKKVAISLVRVKMDAGAANPQLFKEFEEWRQKQGGNAGYRGNGQARPEMRGERHGHGDTDVSVTTMPAHAGGGAGSFRRFLEQKLKDNSDPEAQSHVRAALAHIEAMRAGQGTPEITGVVIDDQGHVLIAWGWIRENAGANFRATTSDGTEVNARYVGANTGRGFAILQLDSTGTPPLPIAQGRPEGGELLMCMVARQGSVGWVTAPAAPPATSGAKENPGDRFPMFGGDDRGPTYLFNAHGELAAIGMEKFALPLEALKNDIAWIIANKKDISPRRLGVKYAPVLPAIRKRIAGLGNKAAVVVQDVAPGSPAEKSGLKREDILLSIDDVSIGLLPQIQVDLSTRTGSVPVEILRAGKPLTLEMPLGDKSPAP